MEVHDSDSGSLLEVHGIVMVDHGVGNGPLQC